jgi:ribosomal protein L23
MLELLTPMVKLERVSRSIDSATFVAAPGVWAQVQADGSLINVLAGVNAKVNKLNIGSASSNIYESHDVEVGRITTMETHGVRVKVDTAGYTGTPSFGDLLVVCSEALKLGKLVSTDEAVNGTYEIVARVEEVNSSSGYIIYRTLSPAMVTINN